MKLKNLFSIAAIFTVLLLASGAARADTFFTADLTGAAMVPPTNSTGKAFVVVQLSSDETQVRVYYTFSGLGGAATGAHIHSPGDASTIAPIFFSLNPPSATVGSGIGAQTISSYQLGNLKRGLWYMDIHTTSVPGGEIRGQIQPVSPFVSILSTRQTVPPNNTVIGGGLAYFILNPSENQIFILSSIIILDGGATTGASVNGPAVPGANGAVVFALTTAEAQSYTFGNITAAQITNLKKGLYYYLIATANSPNGGIRGQIKPANKPDDFDGDSRADIAVWRNNAGTWYNLDSAGGQFNATQWGGSADIPVPADFDLDGRTDLTVWRPTTGAFYTLLSNGNTFRTVQFGQSGDDPRICADYDGDGVADYAVYRPGVGGAAGAFYINGSTRGFYGVNWGTTGDRALIADWDGDRVADITVYRPTNPGYFYALKSTNGQFYAVQWGGTGDKVAAGDVDGDLKADPIVFRTSGAQAGTWFASGSVAGFIAVSFGAGTDTPAPADFDGDGKVDFAVFRNGAWYILQSSNGAVSGFNFGTAGDYPIPFYLVR